MTVDSESNVQVFVRIRPLTHLEREAGTCVHGDNKSVHIKRKASMISSSSSNMSNSTTTFHAQSLSSTSENSTLLSPISSSFKSNLSENKNNLSFSFNHVFWPSQNLSKTFSDMEEMDDMERGQHELYDCIGPRLLDSAMAGFHCCLLAYGQTGSGKSFSMMGDEIHIGVIPRMVCDLFSRLKDTYGYSELDNESDRQSEETLIDENIPYRVQLSYYEIYNEKVRDLLVTNPINIESTIKYRIREHPIHGPYIENLSKWDVHNKHQILALIHQGNKNRTVGQTKMNDNSSRSHAICSMTIIQSQRDERGNKVNGKISKVNLVDLAGSERVSVSGTSGAMVKEGGLINKSLTTLGLVIKALSSMSSNTSQEEDKGMSSPKKSKKKIPFVPFRDSILTWLLKDALGGNSKTTLLATLSPSALHSSETLSTLRYAAQARNIVNNARINEAPYLKIIRELQEEILSLKATIKMLTSDPTAGTFQLEESVIEENRKNSVVISDQEVSNNISKDEYSNIHHQNHPHMFSMSNSQLILSSKENFEYDNKLNSGDIFTKVENLGMDKLEKDFHDIMKWVTSLNSSPKMDSIHDVNETKNLPKLIVVKNSNYVQNYLHLIPAGVSYLTEKNIEPHEPMDYFLKLITTSKEETHKPKYSVFVGSVNASNVKIDYQKVESSSSDVIELTHGTLIEIGDLISYRFIYSPFYNDKEVYTDKDNQMICPLRSSLIETSKRPLKDIFSLSSINNLPISIKMEKRRSENGDSNIDNNNNNSYNIQRITNYITFASKAPFASITACPICPLPLNLRIAVNMPSFYRKPGTSYFVYLITARFESFEWAIERRFSEFKISLHQHYQHILPKNLSSLFPSKWLGAKAALSRMTMLPSQPKSLYITDKNTLKLETSKSMPCFSGVSGESFSKSKELMPLSNLKQSTSTIASSIEYSSQPDEIPHALWEALEKRRQGLLRYLRGLIIWLSTQPFSILYCDHETKGGNETQSIKPCLKHQGTSLYERLEVLLAELPLLCPMDD